MPDVFDQLDSMSKQQGDVFDQAHAQTHPTPKSEWSDEPGPELSYSTGLRQFQPGVANDTLKNFGHAAVSNALVPLAHLGSRLIHGALSHEEEPTNMVTMPTDENPQPKQMFQDIREKHEAARKQEFAQQEQLAGQLAPFDPSRTSAKAGALVGGIAPVIAAGPFAPAMMVAQGYENRSEDIEARQAAGQNVTPFQQAGYLGGGAVLDAGLGMLTPGQAASKALLGRVPQMANPLLNAAKNVAVAGAVGAPEMGAYQAGSNLIRKASGINPQQSLTEGVPEAMGQGAMLGAGGQMTHEALSALGSPVPHVIPDQASENPGGNTGNGKVEDVHTPENRPVEPEPEVAPPANQSDTSPVTGEQPYDFAALRQRMEEGNWQNQPEPENTSTHGDVFDQATHSFEAPGEPAPQDKEEVQALDKRLADRRVAQTPVEDERRVEDRRLPEHTFQTPEEAAPNVFQQAANTQAEQAPPKESYFDSIKRMGAEKITSLAQDEAAGMHVNATGPGSIIHEEVKPALSRFADFVGKGVEAFRSIFPVETKSGDENTKLTFRARQAEGRLQMHQIADEFQPARDAFNKLTPDENLDFQRQMYNGEQQPTPELQKIADAMYKHTNEGRQELEALGHEAAAGWEDQHWNMLWEPDAKKASDLLTRITRPGKLEGPAGFLKSRVLDEFDQGLQKGLVPKYENPVEQFMATTAERTRYIAGVKGMKDLADVNTFKRLKPGDVVPDGWSEIPSQAKGPLNGILKDSLKGDGPVVAPDEVNRILKNIVTPSLFSSGFRGSVYRALQGFNNQATQMLLGLSGFHATKVAKESMLLQNARALDLMAKGETAEAGKAAASGPAGIVRNIARGKEIQDQLLGKSTPTPEEARRNAAMIQGGFSAKSDSTYETQIRRRFSKALQDGGVQGLVRAAVYSPLAANEYASQEGVFKYVQHSKLAIGADLTEDYLRQNPNAGTQDIRKEVGRISDHLDNLLGLMERDNLFWNRTARDLATLGTLSVGWNYGSARELGGGLVDLGKGIGTLAKGGKVSDLDTRRVSYLMTMAASQAMIGAVTTYLATGQGPQNLKDYVFPRSGTKDREGHDVRYNPGLYTSDYYDFLTHPLDTLAAKASPLIHATTDLLKNQDYKHNKIYDTSDKWYKVAGDIAKHLASTNLPMSAQQVMNTISEGGSSSKSTTEKMLPWLGVKHAPVSISESPAELEARSLVADGPRGTNPEKSKVMSDLTKLMRDRDPSAGDKIHQAVVDGKITAKDAGSIHKRAAEPGGLPGLLKNGEIDARTLMEKVWPKMDDGEKRDNQMAIRRRLHSANIPGEDRAAYFKMVDDAVGAK